MTRSVGKTWWPQFVMVVTRNIGSPPISSPWLAESSCTQLRPALIRAASISTFDWRGINYRIEGRDRLRMLGYSPYRPSHVDAIGAQSIQSII
jgi:hypothetical protein